MAAGEPSDASQSISQLNENSQYYLAMSIAPSTRRNYSSAVDTYNRFCNQHQLTPFPPHEQTLILFATHIASFSSHSNVKLHLSGIKHHAIIHNYYIPFRDYLRLYLLMRGIKRSQGRSRSLPKRLPITPSLLRIIKDNLFNSSRLFEDKIMIWAAITTAFFGFLRISEYTSHKKSAHDPSTTLLFTDIAISNHSAAVHIKTSKTDPFRHGVTVRLQENNTDICPVHALRAYIAIHPTQTGPLFRFRNNSFLTRSDINKILKSTSNDAANISSHSLRIGAASTAAAMGYPKYLIQSMGRWSSDCFRRYIRISDNTIRNASRAMATCNIPVPLDFDPRT